MIASFPKVTNRQDAKVAKRCDKMNGTFILDHLLGVLGVLAVRKRRSRPMSDASQRVDQYIDKADLFAQPILRKVRQLFHKACPTIEEAIKWGVPSFEHKGMVANMAAFKKHVNVAFWKAKLMDDAAGLFAASESTSMGVLKVTDASQLPPDNVLLAYIKQAVRLNEDGVKAPKAPAKPRKPLKVPDDLMAALRRSKKALATFEAFAPSHRREYIEWITEAKQEATRQRRLATAIEWMAEGKPRNWKYTKR